MRQSYTREQNLKMKFKVLLLAFSSLTIWPLSAQEIGEYGFLKLPVSPHAAALGGEAISVVEPDAALADQNPALLCPQMSRQMNLSYMNYLSDVNIGYASYTDSFLQEGAWQFGVRYLDYGTFTGYDEFGNYTSDFSAKDMSFQFGVGYPINDRMRIGASTRAIYSKYESYSAFAIGVDLGLNYYNETTGRSLSLLVSNLGGQLKHFDDRQCKLPTQLSLGITKEVEHLPFCFTLTAVDLLDWDQDYIDSKGRLHEYNKSEQVLNHLLWGVEWIASDNFFAAAAYSYRRQREFSGDGGFLRGVSIGAGLKFRQLKVQASYASYNAVDGSLLIGLGYTIK